MRVTIISDASYCPKYRVAGYGYWIASTRGKQGGGGQIIEEVEDTNAAEMMALCNAIWHGTADQLILPQDELLLQTDSLAAIDRLKNTRVVTMTDQQKRVLRYFEKTVSRFQFSVSFRHVKGHTGFTEARFAANRACDKRAKDAMREARKAKIIQPCAELIEEMRK